MLDFIMKVILGLLACVGFIQTASWMAVRLNSRHAAVLRIFPIGGTDKSPGKQMAAMYTCLQWEANPSKQTFVLYDAGLGEQGVRDCESLSKSAGVLFVRNAKELEALLRTL